MAISMADVATVTPELEAAARSCSTACNSADLTFRPRITGCACSSPAIRRGELGRDVVQSALGYLFIKSTSWDSFRPEGSRSEERPRAGQRRGQPRRSRRSREGVPGGGRLSIRGVDSAQQLPCQQPPWGELTAVNVNTGEIAWRVPLGVTDSLPPDKQKTGRPGNGGTIATAGGLVFVGATDDGRFRAFDAKTGKELWTFKLGGAAEATPMTYQGRDGRQYVVITSTGGGFFGNPVTDDSIMAFALDGAAGK